ncbi:glycine cleavage T protein (aminomethyl transferase), partial [gut metagenome]
MSEQSLSALGPSGFFALTDRQRPIIRLDDLALIRVSGKDAVNFLHGQFTNAVQGLGTRTVAAGYCSPKGRLLATFRLWIEDGTVMMILPKA